MEPVRIQKIMIFLATLTITVSLPITNVDSLKSARRRIIIYYNTDQPPALATRSFVMTPITNLSLNANGTVRPNLQIQPNPLPPSLLTIQSLTPQQTGQVRPGGQNQNYAMASENEFVPPTNVPPPSLVSSIPAKAVTAPPKGSPLSADRLPPLFIPASGGWELVTTVSPFAVFVPRKLEARK